MPTRLPPAHSRLAVGLEAALVRLSGRDFLAAIAASSAAAGSAGGCVPGRPPRTLGAAVFHGETLVYSQLVWLEVDYVVLYSVWF